MGCLVQYVHRIGNYTSVRKIFCNFTINRDHRKKVVNQGQSSTPAGILVDNLITSSVH